ncbi:hypothetical protein L195_g060091, partial [Trifolium pratense]
SLKKFKPSFAPFVDRPLGPPWFTQEFPSPPEFEAITNNLWSAYLMPTVLSCRIGLTSGDFGLVGYFPIRLCKIGFNNICLMISK